MLISTHKGGALGRDHTIGQFQITVELNAWDVADLLARRICGVVPAENDSDREILAGLDREKIIALVVQGLEWGGQEEGGLVGNEPEDWYGAYGSEPSQTAVALVRKFLPEFDDQALTDYENHTADENQDN